MGIRERIQNYLRNASDQVKVSGLLISAEFAETKAERIGYETKTGDDYYFVAACYAFALDNPKYGEKILLALRQHAPTYDPSERFGRIRDGEDLERRLKGLSLDGEERFDAMMSEFTEGCNTSREMQNFLERHPEFSFKKIAPYFPEMKIPLSRENVHFYSQPQEQALGNSGNGNHSLLDHD